VSKNLSALQLLDFEYNAVENPIGREVTDGVSALVFFQPGGPLAAVIEQKYGKKAWLDLPLNVDRFRMCDAAE
jgi:hypothetical protein